MAGLSIVPRIDDLPGDSSSGLVPQQRAISRARVALAADTRVLAAWLVGSFATGEADTYSDVDLHCLITDKSADWFRERWQETAVEIVGPVVLARPIRGIIGGYVLTSQWLHLDLIMHPRSTLDPRSVVGLYPIFDRTGDLLPGEPIPLVRRGEPYFPDEAVQLFLYYLGNLPVGIGRGELVHLHGGIFTWREILIEVMLAENGIRIRGGNKRLNPLLTSEQRSVLESLPFRGWTSTRSSRRCDQSLKTSSAAASVLPSALEPSGRMSWKTPRAATFNATSAS